MDWQTLTYKPLYALLADHLGEKIRSGHFPQDAYLPPLRTLMAVFGVSQVTARKAIAVLEADGIVKTFHGSGIRVIRGPVAERPLAGTPSPALDVLGEVRDLFAFRLVLEPAALADALPRIDRAGLQRLQARAEEGAGDGGEAIYRLDERLHAEIMGKCSNRYLRQALADVMRRIQLYRELNFRAKAGELAIDGREIMAVVDAIVAGDGAAAAGALAVHIRSTLANLLSLFTHGPPVPLEDRPKEPAMTNYGQTRIVICEDEADLGRRSAAAVAAAMRALLAERAEIRVVFAAGQSQTAFCTTLAREPDIDWKRVVCFNLDDFWDVRMPEHLTAGAQTVRELYGVVRPKAVNLVRFNAPDPEAECRRFAALLRERPLDILCQGIGTSGHLAFNEPDLCSFTDPEWMRVTEIVAQSKRQLIDDPNFKALGYIPEKGVTMTIPAIFSAGQVFTIVPLALKKPIMTRVAATAVPSESLPASILRTKPGVLFVDRDSCPDAWLS